MPPAAANAVAAPPIAANVTANPPADKSVAVPANHPLVIKTAFLGYDDAPAVGGVQRKQLCAVLGDFLPAGVPYITAALAALVQAATFRAT